MDVFKDEAHVDTHAKFCARNHLKKRDLKRQCVVYFYTRKLERHGTRHQGCANAQLVHCTFGAQCP